MREGPSNGGMSLSRALHLALWTLPFVFVLAFLLWQTRGQTLYADEWFFFVHAAGFQPGNLLAPDQGNMVFGATLVYKATLTVAGAGDHLALRLVWIGLDLLCSALFFALMRKRVGDFAAYVPALVLAVFGSAWEMFSGSLGINVMTSLAAGLAALLAFERDNRRADALGCLLLTFSVVSHSTGLAILAGVIAAVPTRPDRWRRIWIVAIPLVLYAAWWIWARKFGQSSITLETLSNAPAGLIALFASGVASMAGAFRYPGPQEPGVPDLVIIVNQEPGLLLGALLAGAVGWRLKRLRLEWRFLPPFVTIVAYWASIALVSPAREPGTGRYQYASAIFILLILAELWRGWRPSRATAVVIAAVGFVSIVPNAINLHYAADFVRGVSEQDRAKLAVADALRARIPPDQNIEPPPYNIAADVVIPAGAYVKAVDEFGSPGESIESLPQVGIAPQLAADREFVYLLDVKPVAAPLGSLTSRCRLVPAGTIGGGNEFRAPRSGFSFESTAGGEVTLGLRRYGDDFYRFEPVGGGSIYRVLISPDPAPQPWYADLESSAPVRVCSLRRAA
jgi:hypothetical protein